MTSAEYEADDGMSSGFTRWLLPALILSLLLHAGLLYWARLLPINESDKEVYEKVVPRTFHLERVEIDPKVLEPEPAEKKQPPWRRQRCRCPRNTFPSSK